MAGSKGIEGNHMCEEENSRNAEEPPTDIMEADVTTGASPGTAQACDDLGLNSLEANLARFGIKPPGMK